MSGPSNAKGGGQKHDAGSAATVWRSSHPSIRDEMEVLLYDGGAVENALVVVGVPTLGLVGTITAQYLVEKLDMPIVGGIRSRRLPPSASIRKGQANPPIRIHAIETKCGLDLDCERVVVITGELVPHSVFVQDAASLIAEWSRDTNAEMVVIPDGYTTEQTDPEGAGEGAAKRPHGLIRSGSQALAHKLGNGKGNGNDGGDDDVSDEGAKGDASADKKDGNANGEGKDDRLLMGAASTRRALKLLEDSGIDVLDEVTVMGLTGALLLETRTLGTDAVGLLTPTAADHPDARAAARIVEVLDRFIPDIRIDAGPLLEQAERIEEMVREVQAQIAGQLQNPQAAQHSIMFS